MTTSDEPAAAPSAFDWKRWPETEAFVDRAIASALAGNAFATDLSARMTTATSTRFADWVDHLAIADRPGLARSLRALGYARQTSPDDDSTVLLAHEGGIFPAIRIVADTGAEISAVAIRVESIAEFAMANGLGPTIIGPPMGPYRSATVEGASTALLVVERRGYLGFEPFSSSMARQGRMTPHTARDSLAAREAWQTRRRRFEDDEEGFDVADATLDRVIELAGGPDPACHLVFEAERAYWESRNRAARVQKARQDRLGLGWANHDHHTFRSSRRFFSRLIGLFRKLGFLQRERFQAGADAGWGAQILEHPATGVVIFADLDLAPSESDFDFAREPLPDLPRPNTVGLWVALHGESILEAGMHHLECQFDFERLVGDLKADAGVDTMKPFSDFPFLRQAFTAGERWPVSTARAARCVRQGWIDDDQARKFVEDGTIGSHLENLQRREGYKGFNQQSVGAILAATDPRGH